MTSNNFQKKAIRERMANTGEPYSVAAKKIDKIAPNTGQPQETFPIQDVFDPTISERAYTAICGIIKYDHQEFIAHEAECKECEEFKYLADMVEEELSLGGDPFSIMITFQHWVEESTVFSLVKKIQN